MLVLGGGHAGGHVARALGDHGVTMVDPRPVLESSSWPDTELVPGWAIELDPELRVVVVESKAGRLAIAYAQLIVAFGRFARGAPRLGLPHDAQGRVRVDETLRVVGAANIWALGDCAAVPNGAPHAASPTALASFYEELPGSAARTEARARQARPPGR